MKKIRIVTVILLLTVFLYGCSNTSLKVDDTSKTDTESQLTEDKDDSILTTGYDLTEETTEDHSKIGTVRVYGDRTVGSVYVCGAVRNEGVYILPEGSIVNDALDAAGGYDENALHGYINLAAGLEDGMRIWFPEEDDSLKTNLSKEIMTGFSNEGKDTPDERNFTEESNMKVNINTADKNLLMTLPGIGEGRAEDIISYRDDNGGFKSIEEIKNIKGIKDNIFEKIKDMIII